METHQKYSMQFVWWDLPTWDSKMSCRLSFGFCYLIIRIILSPLTTYQHIYFDCEWYFVPGCDMALLFISFHYIVRQYRSDCSVHAHCLSMSFQNEIRENFTNFLMFIKWLRNLFVSNCWFRNRSINEITTKYLISTAYSKHSHQYFIPLSILFHLFHSHITEIDSQSQTIARHTSERKDEKSSTFFHWRYV